MSKFLKSAKHALKRVTPLLLAGATALIASGSFRHYVDAHPGIAVFIPVLAWILHAANAQRTE